jgi:Helix-turn-helix domain/Homeodomain-like domain
MDRDRLAGLLSEGLSLEQIGRRVGRHPSTVGYWLTKHGLRAVNSERHGARGALTREVLEPLIAAGGTQRSIADTLGVSASTVQYWLRRHELRTVGHRRRHDLPLERPDRLELDCVRHGRTTFVKRPGDGGYYRCSRCRSEQVSKQRRRLKLVLVEEAGGRCQLCGYDRWPGALHFHHVEPGEKVFALSQEGSYRSLARARAEARKCALLCANCHAEVEGGFRTLSLGTANGPG